MKEDSWTIYKAGAGEGDLRWTRREFLQNLAAGIFIFFSVEDLFAQETQRFGFQNLPSDFNAFLRIGGDGRVSCFTGKIEMGQGVITSLAQMLGDELDISVDSVDMVMGDTDLCPWDMGTFGSRSTRFFGPPLREAAAEARGILIQLAAECLKIPEDQLQTKEGKVVDKNNGKNQVTYAELVQGKRIEKHLQQKPDLKTPAQFTCMGKPYPRKDNYEKVTGKAQFAGDIHLPNMLYARILRPPVHGAKLKSIDTSALENKGEIQLVRDGDFIAVLHPLPDVAEKALLQIKAQFDLPPAQVDNQNIFQYLQKAAPEGQVVDQRGNLNEVEKLASTTLEATYLNQYVAHAPIEPHTALAKIESDRITVWASTQGPFGAKEEVARALKIPSGKVRIITPFVGGGYGGKNSNPQVVEAARLAKLTGKPVQVAWSRKEEFFYDTFRPAAVVKIQSGVTDQGQMAFWKYDVFFAGERGAEQFYDIPNHREVSHGTSFGLQKVHPFNTGPWRAPGNNTNTFARESHIDGMAAKLAIDPLEFRLKNLKDKRMVRVLNAAEEKFGWTKSKAPSGRGQGVACAVDAGTYVAAMAEVEVDQKSGEVQVKRMVCAQDMGLAINPEGAKMQMEGCLTMGLGYALREEIHFKGGEILDLSFRTYQIPRFSWLPKIETVLVEAPDFPPQGGGEPAIVGVGAVIANAIFDALGIRLFELPMTPEKIQKALHQDEEEKEIKG